MDSQRDARAALEQYRLEGWREVGRELGHGSYAAVVEVDYMGLKCAGKKIHRVLYEDGVGNIVNRFEEECRLLSQLRHPNIVQFLGIYFDPGSNLPVLVMEFLPITLAQCLDTYGVLPEEINHGILRDVALGLRYLHERPQPVVHRDLSANNVLLTNDMRGKISDLGVAKILSLSAAQRSRMTRAPGTLAYMPPEATVPKPRYDVKVDIFSYGVMMLHMLSGRWPFPGEAVRVNPDNPADLTPISEASRRQEYFDDISGCHPLMQLIHLCLSNSPAHRPNASYVAQQVSETASRTPLSFSNRVEMMERIRVDRQQRELLGEENERLSQERDAAAHQQEVLTSQLEELRQQVADQGERITDDVKGKDLLKDHVQALTQEKEAADREKAAKSLEVEDLRLQVTNLEADNARLKNYLKHKDEVYQLALANSDQAHQEAMVQKDQAHKEVLHLKKEAMESKEKAHTLAVAQREQAFQQAMTDKDLAHRETMAAKDKAHQAVLQDRQVQLQAQENELRLLRQELAMHRDTAFQSQETNSRLRDQLHRCRTSLSSNQQVNLFTPGARLVWMECAGLPFPMNSAQAVVINGIVYVGGGGCDSDAERRRVCSYNPGEDEWAPLPPSPVMYFGVGQVSGRLVLVGGKVAATNKVTGDVHMLSDSHHWEKTVPAMPTARCVLTVVSYPTALVACGGKNNSAPPLPTVELYLSATSQWYQCPPLPSHRNWMSSVAIGDTLFLVGGFETKNFNSASKSVVTASLSALTDCATHRCNGSTQSELWTTLKDTPYCFSTAANIGGCLTVLGGKDKPDKGSVRASILSYVPVTSAWLQTGEIPSPLCQSTAVRLPTNQFLIVGGRNTTQVLKGSIDI